MKRLIAMAICLTCLLLTFEGTGYALTPTAGPSEQEITQYLLSAGYPEQVIELMDDEWQLNSYRLKTRYYGALAESYGDRDKVSQPPPVTQQFLGNEFREYAFAEQYRSLGERKDTLRINYLWSWDGTPTFTLVDYIHFDLLNTMFNYPHAEYTVHSDTSSLTLEAPVERQMKSMLVKLDLLRSFQADGVKQKAVRHSGRVWFACYTDLPIMPCFWNRYYHQWLPSLIQPTWSSLGEGFEQWWAPAHFRRTSFTIWNFPLAREDE